METANSSYCDLLRLRTVPKRLYFPNSYNIPLGGVLTFPSKKSVLLVERHAQVVSDILPRLSKFQWVSFSHSGWYLEKVENSSFENHKTGGTVGFL